MYALYKSYSHEGAKEQSIDKRQNILMNPRLWFYAGGMALMLCLCIWALWAYYRHQVDKFSPKDDKGKAVAAAAAAAAAPTGAAVVPGASAKSEKSDSLRVAGEVVLHGERWILLQDQVGTVRLENPAAFVGRGITTVGNVEGQRVTTWTGQIAKQQSIVGEAK